MNNSPVTHENWRENEDFVHFLAFDFSILDAPLSIRDQIITLIPLAVSEERLIGAIKEAVLKAAITAWNRPEENHAFLKVGQRWRYSGTITSTIFALGNICTVKGKLRRNLSPGSYCKAPHFEVWRKS